MVIIMESSATEAEIETVIERLVEAVYDVHRSTGSNHTVLGAVGAPERPVDPRVIELMDGVREVVKISEPYKLVGRTFQADDTLVDIGATRLGGADVVVMAGPCSVESEGQLSRVAGAVQASGATGLRGGAFKPR